MSLNRSMLFAFIAWVWLFTSCRSVKKDINLMIHKEIDKGWVFRKSGSGEWLPATVPGTVHTDLMANRKIEDPFYRLNERDVQWIDKEDWEYKNRFSVEEEYLARDCIQLDFMGLDTYADVYVNDKEVLKADNMFREWWVDVKEFLQPGENELRIVFRSPVKEGIKQYDARDFVIPVSDNDLAGIGQVEGEKKVSVYTRKAAYHFGWDWGPRLVTSGIWRPVYLRAWDKFRIENLQIIQHEVSEEKAAFSAVFETESVDGGRVTLSVHHEGTELVSARVRLGEGINRDTLDFEIKDPRLWWTHNLGDPHLYHLRGQLKKGKQLASRDTRIGIRTLELVREEDEQGTTFCFRLNGHRVFMKGANVIPNDVFIPRITGEKYRKLIITARESNMNMIRVWGGGI